MDWLLFFVLASILFFTPYQKGLFFDRDLYIIEIIVMGCFLLWLIFSFFIKKNKVPRVYYSIFLIPFMFLISFFVAESPKGNFDNLFRWSAYSSFFILLVWLRKNNKIDKTLAYIFQATGISIAIFSLFGFIGWIEYNDIMLKDRLSGPFQYPNVFGAIMGAFWLYSLIMVTRPQKSIWNQVLYSAPLILFPLTFILSYSRGALIVVPVVWFVGLILLKFREQLLYITFTVVSMILTLITYWTSTKIQENSTVFLSVFILCSVVSVILISFLSKEKIEYYYSKITNLSWAKKYGRFSISFAVFLLGILLVLDLTNNGMLYKMLPTTLQDKINDISLETGSALGRTGMYSDSLRISLDSPILGAGGEGWKILYPIYQTEPYYSNEIHNGYLEMVLDIGWLGAILFLTILTIYLYAMFQYRRAQNKEYQVVTAGIIAIFVILFHSFIDFDFSYGTVWFIIFTAFALYLPIDEKYARLKQKNMNSDKANELLSVIGRSVLSLLTLIILIFCVRFYSAEQHLSALSNKKQIGLEQGISYFETIHARNPYNVDYTLNLVNMKVQLFQHSQQEKVKSEIIAMLEKLEKMEPRNGKLQFSIGRSYALIEEWDRALIHIDKSLQYERFNVNYYDTSISLKQQIGFASGDKVGQQYVQAAVKDFEAYTNWYEEYKNRNIPDQRPLEIQKSTYLAAAHSYLFLNRPEDAFELLKKFNPSVHNGIYDEENEKLNVDTFKFTTINDFIQRYSNQLMVISTRGEAVAQLPQSTKELMSNMGSNINELQKDGSYVAIIYGGETLIEEINNEGDSVLSSKANPEFMSLLSEFNIFSGGRNFSNRSSIEVDGKEYSKNRRGMNIAVFDNELNLIRSENFDTHNSDILIYK